ncbi:MAG: nitrile hydratase beta subunit [Gammaproteobacteria bacterium]|jgi:nitrile hydratase beta subunit
MDGIHDVGGKQGYGAIDADEIDLYTIGRAFHHDWEAREWGISRCARTPAITIDWWRHCRELILPVDYLQRPYFDSWAQTDFATYIDGGFFTLDEVCSGHSQTKLNQADQSSPQALSKAELLTTEKKKAMQFDAEIDAQPLFDIGDQVTTNKHGHSGHTRLPQYARNSRGRIHALHGAHVFPDLSAQGEETHQHLYTVVFDSVELWPDAKNNGDKVYLDLWESYFSAGAVTDV